MQLDQYPNLHRLVETQVEVWPQHQAFLDKSLSTRSAEVLETTERLAAQVVRLSAESPRGLEALCENYRDMCINILLPEEEFFRRNNCYRLQKFEDALRQVYQNDALMSTYINGLLMSQVFWSNHSGAFDSFLRRYLPLIPNEGRYLEIGPGHGLFLYLAASTRPDLRDIAAWDVSPTSIAKTRSCLEIMQVARPIDLQLQDAFAIDPARVGQFDAVVISEVLEHLENPTDMLKCLMGVMRSGATIWINVPINCPAPDHLFFMGSMEDAVRMVEASGLEVTDRLALPMSGMTLERCAKLQLTVSCVITARKP